MGYIVDGRPFKYFSIQEIANTKAKEDVKILFTPELIRHGLMMDDLREWYGGPLNVSSWYRTKSFNTSINGDKNSCHLDGIATDIVNIPWTRFDECIKMWWYLCQKYGVIGGVSIYDWGLHFDSNADPNRYGTINKNFRITDYRR